MSTSEAAWPEELIEACADAEWKRESAEVAPWHRAHVRSILNCAVAWRDPKGEPAVVRADDLTATAWIQARRRAKAAEAERDALRAALSDSRREHLYVDDCWYSCPKSIDGCCDEAQGDDCNCGADAWNARIDALLAGVDHGE